MRHAEYLPLKDKVLLRGDVSVFGTHPRISSLKVRKGASKVSALFELRMHVLRGKADQLEAAENHSSIGLLGERGFRYRYRRRRS